MKNILFPATHPQRFADQLHFAKELREVSNGTIAPHFYIGDNVREHYSTSLKDFPFPVINSLKPDQQDVTAQQSIFSYANITHYFRDKLKSVLGPRGIERARWAKNQCSHTFLADPFLQRRENRILAMLRGQQNKVMRHLQGYRFAACLTCGDRHGGLEPVFLKICQDLRIPVIIPYMVYFGEEDDLVRSKIKKGRNRLRGKSILESRYILSAQKYHARHCRNDFFFYPHTWANAVKRYGVLSDNPWFIGSGKSDILCLPNVHLRDHYVRNGVSVEKIRIVGDVSYDLIFRGSMAREDLRAELTLKYGLSSDKNIIICALPQLAEHNMLPWNKHWEEIEFLCHALSGLGHNVLLSLHPKMDRTKYEYLSKKYRCSLLDVRLAQALPAADIFVAMYSSTVLWAVMCGCKALVLDYFGYSLNIFDFLQSIDKVSKKQSLPALLSQALSVPADFTQDWQALSRSQVFDGKTIQRYVDLIEEVGGIHN